MCQPVDLTPAKNSSGVLVAPPLYTFGFKKQGKFHMIPENYFCVVTIPNYYRQDGTPSSVENSKKLGDCSYIENCKFLRYSINFTD